MRAGRLLALLVPLLVLLLGGVSGSQYKSARLQRWSLAALGFVKQRLCGRVSFLSVAECGRLAQIPQTAVSLSAAEPRAGDKVLTILPDSGLSLGPPHDAVITLDTSPQLSFGHPLSVFFIDFSVNERRCLARSGLYLGDHECMTLALKSRCENVLKRRTSRAERQNARGRGRKRPVGPRDAGRPQRENAGTVGPGHTGRPRRESAGTVGPGHTGRPRRENAGTVGPGRTGRPRRESAGTVGPGRTGRPRRESAGTVGPGHTGRSWRENAGTVGPGRTGRPRRESAGTVGPGRTGRPRRESAGTVGPGHTGRSWRENAGTVGPGRTGRPRRESAGTVAERARREDWLVGLCEIHFVPLVVGQRDENKEQRLHCVEQKGFAPCPRPLAMGGPHPASAHCELNKNTQRCHRQQLSSRQSCRVYQTCDHGLLLSGGWKEHLTNQQHVNNLVRFQRMLRTNGFRSENIKTFFAGDGQLPVGEESEGVFPATEKVMIRSHLSYICRATNCADSLVLYLNSPTRNDGTMLLWDVNNNGIADQKEKYSVGELLTDLEGCKANRVFIFIDQSYPGTLVKRLRSSNKHPNVAIIGNSQGSDFTWAPSFTELWAGLQPNQCISDYILKNFAWAASSSVGVVEATPGLVNSTIYGGPCRNNPPLTPEEMKREFMGCQNLPTAVWYQTVQRKDPTP